MTDITALDTQLSAAYAVYQASNREIALLSVTLIAAGIREGLPDAKSVSLDWSDQGDFLSLRTVDESEFSDDVLDDLTEYAWNLGGDNKSAWEPFLVVVNSTGRSGNEIYTMDLDLALTAAATI